MRILKAAVAAAAAITLFVSSAVSVGALTILRGDADGDGIVTIMDATSIQLVLAELKDDTDGMIALRGSVIGEDLDIMDATAIQRYLADLGNDYAINMLEIDGIVLPVDDNQLPILSAK